MWIILLVRSRERITTHGDASTVTFISVEMFKTLWQFEIWDTVIGVNNATFCDTMRLGRPSHYRSRSKRSSDFL